MFVFLLGADAGKLMKKIPCGEVYHIRPMSERVKVGI
jgi:hypothetical protein